MRCRVLGSSKLQRLQCFAPGWMLPTTQNSSLSNSNSGMCHTGCGDRKNIFFTHFSLFPTSSQLLGLPALEFQTTSPVITASDQQGDNVLTWMMVKSFRVSHSSLRDRGWVRVTCSSSSSHSGSAFSSSLTERADFCFQDFFLCIWATGTSTGWFSGSAAVPVTRVWVPAVPLTRVDLWVVLKCCLTLNKGVNHV